MQRHRAPSSTGVGSVGGTGSMRILTHVATAAEGDELTHLTIYLSILSINNTKVYFIAICIFKYLQLSYLSYFYRLVSVNLLLPSLTALSINLMFRLALNEISFGQQFHKIKTFNMYVTRLAPSFKGSD